MSEENLPKKAKKKAATPVTGEVAADPVLETVVPETSSEENTPAIEDETLSVESQPAPEAVVEASVEEKQDEIPVTTPDSLIDASFEHEEVVESIKDVLKVSIAPPSTGAAAFTSTLKQANLIEETPIKKAQEDIKPFKISEDALFKKSVAELKTTDVVQLALQSVIEAFRFDAPTKGTERAIRTEVHNTLIQFDHHVALTKFSVIFGNVSGIATLDVDVSIIRSSDQKQVDYYFSLSAA